MFNEGMYIQSFQTDYQNDNLEIQKSIKDKKKKTAFMTK